MLDPGPRIGVRVKLTVIRLLGAPQLALTTQEGEDFEQEGMEVGGKTYDALLTPDGHGQSGLPDGH
jgi:hypothetical protein